MDTRGNKERLVQFCGFNCRVEVGQYRNGRIALSLYDIRDGQPLATATLNLPAIPLATNEVFIKDYCENAGMLAALEGAGIIRQTETHVTTGIGSMPVCEVLIPLPGQENSKRSGNNTLDDLRREPAAGEAKPKSRDYDRER